MDTYKKELYKQRRNIGLLGMMLPFLLYFGSDIEKVLSSFSHYYYTRSSLFFIAIIFAFAIMLFSYQGYEKLPSEKISDNVITSIAAFFAVVVVLVPTTSMNAEGPIHFTDSPYLFGHVDNMTKKYIHLGSAGIFISLLGYMSYFKFTLSSNNSQGLNMFYKTCGIIIWASIVIMIVLMILEKQGVEVGFPYVFVFEVVAIEAFAISWLRKAKTVQFLA
ncbi:hypothetical protein KFE94_00845 [bacterium SCSIO 12643]|nr:hypothetical protein KFE94_00845 [bacterium SCSIO 12643]